MTLEGIVCRNLRRRKGKAALVLCGLALAVATVVSLNSLVESLGHDISSKLEQYGANILITPKSENLAISYGGLSLGGVSFDTAELRQTDLAAIKSIPNAANIAAVGPVVLGKAASGQKELLVAGVEFTTASILRPWWRIQGRPPSTANEVILGADVAAVLRLGPGGRLSLNGGEFVVAGVLGPTGSQDDKLVFAHLETGQRILHKEGTVSMVEVAALCKDCPVEIMVEQIAAKLPGAKVTAIQQVVKGRMETIRQFKNFSVALGAIVVLVAAMMVMVTMASSVRERTTEIGIFRALGFRRAHVIRIVLMEAALVSAGAGIAGQILGYGAAKVIFPLVSGPQATGVVFPLNLGATALGLALTVGLLASAYPALLAARLDPNDALRTL